MPPRSLSSYSNGGNVSLYSVHDDCESCDELKPLSPTKMNYAARPLTKTFRFSEQNEIHPIPHLNDITEEEVANIWFCSKEYSEIKSSYQMTIFMMENGDLKEDDEHTCRGLEYRTQQGAWSRYENKRDAYNAVLDEQDRQWNVDKDDHDEISRVYLNHSAKCAEAAAKRGENDAKEARAICHDIIKRRKVRRKKSKGLDSSPSKAAPPMNGERVRQLLREQSFSRRGQIREDIEKQQAKALKKDKRSLAIATSA